MERNTAHAWYAQTTAITIIAALICLVGLSRSISAVYFQRQLAYEEGVAQPIWGFAYELGAWCYAALLGIQAFAALVLTHNAELHVLAVGMVASYSGGISGRNAGRIHVAVGQTCLSLLPTSLGLILVGGLVTVFRASGLQPRRTAVFAAGWSPEGS